MEMSKQTILDYESTAAGLNSKAGNRGPYKRGTKSTETASVVGVYEDAPPPSKLTRLHTNIYDREALTDFYDGPMLAPALALYEDCINMGHTAKAAFSQVLFQLSATK
jgi:hypothetical protein